MSDTDQQPDIQTDNQAAEIKLLLESFRTGGSTYRRAEIDQAIARQEEVVPHLIRLLEETREHPQKHLTEADHIYALMILGHLRVTAAHPAILALAALPEKIIDPLLGDLISEDLPTLLINSCGGQLDGIKALVENAEAYTFCRDAALTALTYAVVEEFATQAEILAYMGNLLAQATAADEDTEFCSDIVLAMLQLYPEEQAPIIERAYAAGLIDPKIINEDQFHEELIKGQEKALAALRDAHHQRSLEDLHGNLSSWAMFRPDAEELQLAPATTPPRPKPSAAVAKQKKTRRKMAKASRKHQRRR